MDELRKAFETLRAAIDAGARKVETVFDAEKRAIETELRSLEQKMRDDEQLIREQDDLIAVLDKCNLSICPYRTQLEEILKRRRDDTLKKDLIAGGRFHFFVCYRQDYASRISVIDAHRKVIDEHSFCWFGKFFQQRDRYGRATPLEPFGESIPLGAGASVANSLRDKVTSRVDDHEGVYLYLYNPNPPDLELHVANVLEFYFADERIPYEDAAGAPPQCLFLPNYYFHKSRSCAGCTTREPKKCALRFTCNFWFKLDDIKPVPRQEIDRVFANLKNCFTKDHINFAIPILYPLIVTQVQDEAHFPEKETPFSQSAPYTLEAPERERGHTDMERVKTFFDQLHEATMRSFVRVTMSSRFADGSSRSRVRVSDKNDEVRLRLRSGFRTAEGDASIDFVIHLDRRTSAGQRKKVELLIEKHLEEHNL